MDDHSELRTMIEQGRDKIEWYRQVDPTMLRTVQDMVKNPNFKENLPTIMRTVYEFAFITYAGHWCFVRNIFILKHVFRPAQGTHQEQQHAEAGSQDSDGDPAPRHHQQGPGETGGAGGQPRLRHVDGVDFILRRLND